MTVVIDQKVEGVANNSNMVVPDQVAKAVEEVTASFEKIEIKASEEREGNLQVSETSSKQENSIVSKKDGGRVGGYTREEWEAWAGRKYTQAEWDSWQKSAEKRKAKKQRKREQRKLDLARADETAARVKAGKKEKRREKAQKRQNKDKVPEGGVAVNWNSFAEKVKMLQLSEEVQGVVSAMTRAAQTAFGDEIVVFPFGSSATGFATADSDIDLCLRVRDRLDRVSKSMSASILTDVDFLAALRNGGFVVKEKILRAKVPILNLAYTSPIIGKQNIVDLSVNNGLPLFNSLLLMKYGQLCPEVIELASRVKAWAKKNGVHSAKLKYLSSYAFNLMVVFFFQARGVLPCLQFSTSSEYYRETDEHFVPNDFYFDVSIDLDAAPNTISQQKCKSASVLDFLNFYRKEYKWGSHAISVRTGKMMPLEELPSLKIKRELLDVKGIAIEDPFDISRNLSKSLTPANMKEFHGAIFFRDA